MSLATFSATPSVTKDDCSICLSALNTGLPLLTLSCGHTFHLQCSILNVKTKNKECPSCRLTLETSLSQLLFSFDNNVQQQQPSQNFPLSGTTNGRVDSTIATLTNDISSVEETLDKEAIMARSSRIASAQQAATVSTSESFPLITVSTTLEFGGQISHEDTNMYGLVTLKAPSINPLSNDGASSVSSRVPIDLVCVVDQSRSMSGEKMILLKETLVYIAEQLNEFDRFGIVSFDTRAFDRSHGLKRMNEANQQALKRKINDDIHPTGGTYIGCGLEKGIKIFTKRQTKNPVSALLLLTDGQDNEVHDYSQLMQTCPEDVTCYTFGYGPDHSADLLVTLAEQGNGGSFTYVDQQQSVGPAFATVIGGLLSCVAKQIRVNIEFNGEYQVTHVHSKYKHQPDQLPTSKLTWMLKDLNADEQRNLVFQLHVPKINIEQSVDMLSQEAMSQSLSEDVKAKPINNPVIGHVSITYIDPNSSKTLNTTPVPFHLIRASELSSDLLQIDQTLDRQRNRVETVLALKRAMDEKDYKKSLAILQVQVQKIEASVSAQDSFCQQLIKDLKHRYPREQDYRSTASSAFVQQSTERGTYAPPCMSSVDMYQTPNQQQYVNDYNVKRFKKS